MMHNHPNEGPDNNRGIHFDKRPVTLPLTYVATKELVNSEDKLIEKHLCEFVFLES